MFRQTTLPVSRSRQTTALATAHGQRDRGLASAVPTSTNAFLAAALAAGNSTDPFVSSVNVHRTLPVSASAAYRVLSTFTSTSPPQTRTCVPSGERFVIGATSSNVTAGSPVAG